MTASLLMTRLDALAALLDRSDAPLNQRMIGEALGMTLSAVSGLVTRAVRLNIAVLVKPQQFNGQAGTTPNLYARDRGQAVQVKPRLTRAETRYGLALELLREYPHGLTQKQIDKLTQWGHSGVGDCMIALERSGRVVAVGGTPNRPKNYVLPNFTHLPPLAPPRPVVVVVAAAPLVAADPAPRLVPVPCTYQEAADAGLAELWAARKLLVGLSVKNAKTFQHRSGYTAGRASRVFAELQAIGWA